MIIEMESTGLSDQLKEVEMDLLGLAFATNDKKEGMEAFLARRKPEFHDF